MGTAELIDYATNETIRDATCDELLEALGNPGGVYHHEDLGTDVYVLGELDRCFPEVVEQLRGEARKAGDPDMVSICDRALEGEQDAVAEVAEALNEAR